MFPDIFFTIPPRNAYCSPVFCCIMAGSLVILRATIVSPMNLKSYKFSVTIPGEMRELADAKWKKEKYTGMSEYVQALILFDLCSDREHTVTGPLMREPQWSRDAIITALLDEAKAGRKVSGWFDRIVEDRVTHRLRRVMKGRWQSNHKPKISRDNRRGPRTVEPHPNESRPRDEVKE
jgi:Arc/MetJ-type ribon-helix-helix transcriptional regulator